ncbi:MAG: asparagine synthase-related protein [Victivallales bacterium]|nr:asparagine synthase-related protein [Victivallales bacterium]
MIAGILQRKNNRYKLTGYKDSILETLDFYKHADNSGSYQNDNALLLQTTRWNTHNSKYDPTPYINRESGKVSLFWGRLTNNEDLNGKLGFSLKDNVCDSEIVAQAYLKWGEKCPEYLRGEFSCCIYDLNLNSIFCVQDQMGVKPFYYYLDDDIFVFSSTLSTFYRLDMVTMTADMEWALKYLVNQSKDFEKTPFVNIRKLKPAHQLLVSPSDSRQAKYFEFDIETRLLLKSTDAYAEAYRVQLEKAVAARIRTDYPLGSESSGGLDSSAVTALALNLFDQPFENFYTYGIQVLEQEPEYLLELHRFYANKIHNGFISSTFSQDIESLTRSIRVLGYPVEHSNSTGHCVFYRNAANSGVRTLLSGFGGDEFVTNKDLFAACQEFFNSKSLLKAWKILPGVPPVRLLRLLKQYLRHRLYHGKKIARPIAGKYWLNNFIKDELIDYYKLKDVFEDGLSKNFSYRDHNQYILAQRFSPNVPVRMGNCTLMADSYGIDYSWPLFDVDLIQFFFSVPTEYKFMHGITRYLHRKAVADIVPPKINWKADKCLGKAISPNFSDLELLLDDSLHPDLCPLIDNTRYSNIKDRFLALESAAVPGTFIGMYLRNLHMLNLWLKSCFPNGVAWGNTPEAHSAKIEKHNHYTELHSRT